MGEDDPWYCNRCKKHQQAYKKFDLWTVPDILVVHLKRFQYSAHYRDKIDTLIEFPLDNLDLREYCRSGQQDAIFDLFAVSHHSGGLGAGHYTAYAKNKLDGKFYYFNDSSTSVVMKEDQVRGRSAYVLFYRKRGDVFGKQKYQLYLPPPEHPGAKKEKRVKEAEKKLKKEKERCSKKKK